MKLNRIDYIIIIALSCCLVIALSDDKKPEKVKEPVKDENYYDSVQVVTDAVKDSNSSHIPY